jgi:predicted ATP-grasp superfamily ATP-dependent carboligase
MLPLRCRLEKIDLLKLEGINGIVFLLKGKGVVFDGQPSQ